MTRHTLLLLVAWASPAMLLVVLPQAGLRVQHRRPAVAALMALQQQGGEQPQQLDSAAGQHRPATARSGGWVQRTMRRLLMATTIASAGVLMRVPGFMPPAVAVPTNNVRAKKTVPKARIKKKAGKSQGGLASIVIVGGASFIVYRVTSSEDEEEQQRIVDETEKMEKMEKEFTDIDGGVMVDEDLLASLKKRMENSTSTGDGTDGGDAPPTTDGPTDVLGGDDTPPLPTPDEPMGGGGAAVLDEPPPPSNLPSEEPAAPPTPGASEADIERLKRMFGSGE